MQLRQRNKNQPEAVRPQQQQAKTRGQIVKRIIEALAALEDHPELMRRRIEKIPPLPSI